MGGERAHYPEQEEKAEHDFFLLKIAFGVIASGSKPVQSCSNAILCTGCS